MLLWIGGLLLLLSHSVVSSSLQHQGRPLASLPVLLSWNLLKLLSLECPNSCSLSAHPTISSSTVPFCSYPQSFPAYRSFLWVSSLHQMAKVWNGYTNIQVLAFTSFELLLSILSSSQKWIVGLYSISICNFFRNCHTVFHNGLNIFIQV